MITTVIPRPGSGPGTLKAGVASPRSTAPSRAPPTRRHCRWASTPLQLHSLATPNGIKVTILLEELLAAGHQGAEYDAWLINILEGDQFSSGFVANQPQLENPGPCWTPVSRRRHGSLNPAPSWCTWRRSSAPSFPPTPRPGPSASPGYSGRWAPLPTWAEDSATSTPTPRKSGSTPSIATRWRSSANWTCSTRTWRSAVTYAVTTIRSPIWLSTRGTASSSSANCMTGRSSSMRRPTRTSRGGPGRSSHARQCSAVNGSTRNGGLRNSRYPNGTTPSDLD